MSESKPLPDALNPTSPSKGTLLLSVMAAAATAVVIVFGAVLPVLLWRSLRDPQVEPH